MIVIALVIAALTTMQLYMKRGIQAAIKVAADELAPQKNGDVVTNIARGGFLIDEKSSSKIEQNANKKELTALIERYLINESTNTASVSSYSEGRIRGEFNKE